MPKSKSDISNSALRIFLQRVGKFYDELRGLDEFKPTSKQKREILDFFGERCCYCDAEIYIHTLSLDHLIPMNKESLVFMHGVTWCLAVQLAIRISIIKNGKPIWEKFVIPLNILVEKQKSGHFSLSTNMNQILSLKPLLITCIRTSVL